MFLTSQQCMRLPNRSVICSSKSLVVRAVPEHGPQSDFETDVLISCGPALLLHMGLSLSMILAAVVCAGQHAATY